VDQGFDSMLAGRTYRTHGRGMVTEGSTEHSYVKTNSLALDTYDFQYHTDPST